MIRTALLLMLTLSPAAAAAQQRVVALGGSVTEIVFALGQEDRLVGRDSTSTYPVEAQALPDLGYVRALSAEGVLSVDPDLILAEEGAGPPGTLDLLRQSGIAFVTVPGATDAAGVVARIAVVGDALGVGERASGLAKTLERDLAQVAAERPADPARVLFLISVQGGKIMASGRGTAADAMIHLAGGINVIDAYKGYKTITDEALGATSPDVVLLMDRGASDPDTAAGAEALDQVRALPALAATKAVREGRVVKMDGLYLLGFGPRTAAAARDLATAIAP